MSATFSIMKFQEMPVWDSDSQSFNEVQDARKNKDTHHCRCWGLGITVPNWHFLKIDDGKSGGHAVHLSCEKKRVGKMCKETCSSRAGRRYLV